MSRAVSVPMSGDHDLPKAAGMGWARRVRKLVEAGDVRRPDAILQAIGMEDAAHRKQVLAYYEREFE